MTSIMAEYLKKSLQKSRELTVVFFAWDGYEILDLYGPLEVFGVWNFRSPKVEMVVKLNMIGVGEGRTRNCPDVITVDNYDNAPNDSDILILPGGNTTGLEKVAKDKHAMSWIRRACDGAKVVMSVSNGVSLLCSLGLLDGVRATTSNKDFQILKEKFPKVDWVHQARWCEAGKFFTSSGVSAGVDLALEITRQVQSSTTSRFIAQLIEFEHCEDQSDDAFHKNDPALPVMVSGKKTYKVGLVLFDNFELFDTFGVLEMLECCNKYVDGAFTVTTFGETKVMKSSKGPSFKVDHVGFEDVPEEYLDILFLPGGIGSTRELFNAKFMKWFTAMSNMCEIVFTVCSGSAVLAKTGLLDHRKATTTKMLFPLLVRHAGRANVEWQERARWVVDGKFYTSSGVSAGTDLALHLIEQLHGEEIADQISRHTEWRWDRIKDPQNDPFTVFIPKFPLNGIVFTVVDALITVVFKLGFMVSDMKTSKWW